MTLPHRKFLAEVEHLESPFGGGTFGAKAEAFARFFGTLKFLIAQTLIVAGVCGASDPAGPDAPGRP